MSQGTAIQAVEGDEVSASLPSQLFGYDVLDLIGTGAGSRVYAVSEPQTGQLYVLKHVAVRGAKDERFVTQLETEHEVARHLTHPGLRRSIDLKVTRSLLRKPLEAALVLELFDGSPIEFVLPGTCAEIVRVFRDAAEALAALHKAGFVHCDLKPGNILLSTDGHVKLIDFGQACRTGTAKQRIQGTPDFMAPEQVKCRACTPQTDVYSLGAAMYWALTRQKMPTLYTVKQGHNSFLLDAKIAAPRELKSSVPEPLSNFVMECVRTDPARRPSSMADVARRLDVLRFAATRANQPIRPSANAHRPDETLRGVAVAVA